MLNTTPLQNKTTTGTFSATISGLTEGTEYEFRAVAENTQGTVYGSTLTFTTNSTPNAPTNPTPADSATGISTSPTISVDVSDPDGDNIDVSFYDASDDSQIGATQTGVTSGSTASVSWSGLTGETSYNWYAVADDGVATTQSSNWSFTTESTTTTPAVTTNSATGVGTNQADFNGDLTDLGGASSVNVNFEWGSQAEGLINTTTVDSVATTGSFSTTTSGLSPNTIYEFRAVAENTQGTVYGLTESFTTGASNPSVSTQSERNVSTSDNQVTLRGNLSYMGGYDSVDVYFEWGDSELNLTSQSTPQTVTSTGYFSDTVSVSLVSGDKYYFRAVAENSNGTDYGEIDNFTAFDSAGTITLEFKNQIVNIQITKEGLIQLLK
jgi:subtilisin